MLSPDGRTVYAALYSSSPISAIDTATLTETTRYPVAGGRQPASIAVTQGEDSGEVVVWERVGADLAEAMRRI